MLVILTPATAKALTTVASLRARFPDLSDKTDRQLGALIAEASSRIAGFCQREFALTTYRQTTRGICRPKLDLEAPGPIVSIDAVTVDGVTKTEGTDFELDAGTLYRLSNDKRVVWTGSKTVVDYKAGYVLPGGTTPTLPAAIEGACLTLVAHIIGQDTRDPALSAETVFGVAKFEYGNAALKNGLPTEIAEVLDAHIFRTLV